MHASTSSQPSCVLLQACSSASVQRKEPSPHATSLHAPASASHTAADAQTCSLVQPSRLVLHDCSTGPTHCIFPASQTPGSVPPVALLPPPACLPPLALAPAKAASFTL